ncbi:DUF998 domain-containing protein [Streptomyces sp. YIM 98790]|uniref:DUF998 domain-containing protein n=1 Tax=Streptomyces sp. YIM 98790 TaxID=2689077 RepID=UPI00140DF15B|nr:DUF998 domain-containing protein [Streptomyces sp. YIM 98790]
MTTRTAPVPAPAAARVLAAVPARPSARGLLAAGAAAGPLFTTVAAAQVLTRDGFDLARQPLSLLSLGELGWIQIANFVVAGLLSVAGAAGLRRVLAPGRARAWAVSLVAVYGAALAAAGIFVTDPSMGFPAGAPEGPAEQLSTSAILHGVAAPVAYLALVTAMFVLARIFARDGHRNRAAWSAAAGAAVVVIMAVPHHDSISWRMAIGAVAGFAWLTAVTTALAGPRTRR